MTVFKLKHKSSSLWEAKLRKYVDFAGICTGVQAIPFSSYVKLWNHDNNGSCYKKYTTISLYVYKISNNNSRRMQLEKKLFILCRKIQKKWKKTFSSTEFNAGVLFQFRVWQYSQER
jgi:hypothetical protein